MASINISTFDADVKDYVKGIDLSQYATLLAGAERDGIRRFCRDTGILQTTLSDITVALNDRDYDLSLPTDDANNGKSELVHVVWAKFHLASEDATQFRRLTPRTRQYMENYYGDAWEYQTGTPTIFIVEEPDTVILYPIPDAAAENGKLSVRVSLQPTFDATKIVDWLYGKYQEVILLSILSEVYGYTNKPWSNQELADKAMAAYRNELFVAQNFRHSGLNETDFGPFFSNVPGSRSSDGSV